MLRARGGLTLVEVLVVAGSILLLLALLVPAVLIAREGARRTQHHQRMMEMGQAFHQHQAFHQQLPSRSAPAEAEEASEPKADQPAAAQ